VSEILSTIRALRRSDSAPLMSINSASDVDKDDCRGSSKKVRFQLQADSRRSSAEYTTAASTDSDEGGTNSHVCIII